MHTHTHTVGTRPIRVKIPVTSLSEAAAGRLPTHNSAGNDGSSGTREDSKSITSGDFGRTLAVGRFSGSVSYCVAVACASLPTSAPPPPLYDVRFAGTSLLAAEMSVDVGGASAGSDSATARARFRGSTRSLTGGGGGGGTNVNDGALDRLCDSNRLTLPRPRPRSDTYGPPRAGVNCLGACTGGIRGVK
jgi:hypothetical protein